MTFGFLSTGELSALTCAIVWAIAIVLFRISGNTLSPIVLNLFKNTVGFVLFCITLPLLGIAFLPEHLSANDFAIVCLSGLLGVGIADSLFFASLNRLGVTSTAIVDSLYSPLVVLAAFVYLSEPIDWKILVAMALMAIAIVVGTAQPPNESSPTETSHKRTITGIILGISGLALMAISIVIIKPVLERHNAWWVSTVRLAVGIAALSLQVSLPRYHKELITAFRPSKLWKITIPAGIIGCYFTMITWIWGIQMTLASVASILNQSSTLIVIVLAAVFLKEKLTVRKIAAVAMAFAGIILVSV